MDKLMVYSKTIVGFLLALVAGVVDVTLVNTGTDVPQWVMGFLRLLETGGGFLGLAGLRASIGEVLRRVIGEDKSLWHSKTIIACAILFGALVVDYVLPGFGVAVPPWLNDGLTWVEGAAASVGIVGLRQAVGRALVAGFLGFIALYGLLADGTWVL